MLLPTYRNKNFSQGVFKLAEFFSHRLELFLAPLLLQLGELLDKGLVDIFQVFARALFGFVTILQVYF